jgi:hypothetical protein
MLDISSAPIKQHEASQKTAAKSPLLHSTAGSARHITPAASLKLNLTIVSDPRCRKPYKRKCLLLRFDVVPSPIEARAPQAPNGPKGTRSYTRKEPSVARLSSAGYLVVPSPEPVQSGCFQIATLPCQVGNGPHAAVGLR